MALEQGNPRITLAEYMALPEGHYNLIEGVLLVTPAASPRHQTLVQRLTTALSTHVHARKLGAVWPSVDVFLREIDPAVVVQPDVLYVARGGKARVERRGVVGAPDLAIEVLSPGNPRLDTVKKRALYDEFGVIEYWMVLPDLDQVQVLRRDANGQFGHPMLLDADEVLSTPLLPGFELPLTELFEPDALGPMD